MGKHCLLSFRFVLKGLESFSAHWLLTPNVSNLVPAPPPTYSRVSSRCHAPACHSCGCMGLWIARVFPETIPTRGQLAVNCRNIAHSTQLEASPTQLPLARSKKCPQKFQCHQTQEEVRWVRWKGNTAGCMFISDRLLRYYFISGRVCAYQQVS